MARDGCEDCFYCDRPLASRHEHDHFPIPARFGGVSKVPCCVQCHAMKDQTPMLDWPPDDLWQAFREMTPRARLLTAKLLAMLGQQHLPLEDH